MPPAWGAPTPDMLVEVAALRSYRDLFVDNGEAVHAAMEWARNPTGRELERVVPYELYTLLAKRVFEQGFAFRVEPESGKPSLKMVGPIPVSPADVEREKLAQWAERNHWPDLETIVGLREGFRDGSDATPRLCSFARVGARNEREKEAWREKVATEVDRG